MLRVALEALLVLHPPPRAAAACVLSASLAPTGCEVGCVAGGDAACAALAAELAGDFGADAAARLHDALYVTGWAVLMGGGGEAGTTYSHCPGLQPPGLGVGDILVIPLVAHRRLLGLVALRLVPSGEGLPAWDAHLRRLAPAVGTALALRRERDQADAQQRDLASALALAADVFPAKHAAAILARRERTTQQRRRSCEEKGVRAVWGPPPSPAEQPGSPPHAVPAADDLMIEHFECVTVVFADSAACTRARGTGRNELLPTSQLLAGPPSQPPSHPPTRCACWTDCSSCSTIARRSAACTRLKQVCFCILSPHRGARLTLAAPQLVIAIWQCAVRCRSVTATLRWGCILLLTFAPPPPPSSTTLEVGSRLRSACGWASTRARLPAEVRGGHQTDALLEVGPSVSASRCFPPPRTQSLATPGTLLVDSC